MTTTTKEKKPDGLLGIYRIIDAPGPYIFYMTDLPEWQKLKDAEADGTIGSRFPRSREPKAWMGLDKRMLAKMRRQFQPDGTYETHDLNEVLVALDGLKKKIGCKARLDDHSLPLPDETEKEKPKKKSA